MSDRALAERLVRAGAAAARAAGTARTAAKSADPVDVVGAADHAAEAAMVALLPPGDAVLAEESGAHGHSRRTWVLDPVDGTANFQARRGGLWCCGAALVDDGVTVASAVLDGGRDELWSAARGRRAAFRVSAASDLRAATVACFLPRQLGDPAATGAIAAAVGALVAYGCGLLELAWVACGRLDGWLQRNPAPWDWLPGAMLVEAAGGAARVTADGWHLAGPQALVDALEREAPWTR